VSIWLSNEKAQKGKGTDMKRAGTILMVLLMVVMFSGLALTAGCDDGPHRMSHGSHDIPWRGGGHDGGAHGGWGGGHGGGHR
jgi:hypothetical protein